MIRALIGSRVADFLSCREYPNHGLTAITRLADAPWAASTISINSMIASLVEIPVSSLPHIGCTMNTSAPRIDSS